MHMDFTKNLRGACYTTFLYVKSKINQQKKNNTCGNIHI